MPARIADVDTNTIPYFAKSGRLAVEKRMKRDSIAIKKKNKLV